MSNTDDTLPEIESSDPIEPEDAAEAPGRDSEIDFDDERDDDQLPLDQVEAIEIGAMLDDPEELAENDDEDED